MDQGFPISSRRNLTEHGQEPVENLSHLLGCVNPVHMCVFNDNFENILKYNKEEGQELPS